MENTHFTINTLQNKLLKLGHKIAKIKSEREREKEEARGSAENFQIKIMAAYTCTLQHSNQLILVL